jgi:predicted nucleotidyltransferase
LGLEEIKRKVIEDLNPILNNLAGILIYGSLARGEENERSDVDICLVAPGADGIRLSRKALTLERDERLDIRVFELMPLYMKMAVIEEGLVVYSKDIPGLYEYFYSFRRIWEDQKHRQMINKKEALGLLTLDEKAT